ncbi:DsbA family protein [Rhizobium binae]|uniref:DsbA family protein n=1 Tax=Rhizobium binae TaxID=1138190 RepID=UPI003DA7B821
MELVLVADPMCSWCYGFSQELERLIQRHPSTSIQVVLGGLRAGATDVLNDAGKQFRLHHWEKVEQASGARFNRDGLLGRVGFVYDTEPVCRAVVTARILRPDFDPFTVFRAYQHAFYVEAADTTDGLALAEIGSRALSTAWDTVSADEFLRTWKLQSTIDKTAADFAIARAMGVNSFPNLFLKKSERLYEVSNGYTSVDQMEKVLSIIAA